MRFKDNFKVRHVDITRLIHTNTFRSIPFDELTAREKMVIESRIIDYSKRLYTMMTNFHYKYRKEDDIWLPYKSEEKFEENPDIWRTIRREKLARYALKMFRVKNAKAKNRYDVISKNEWQH